MKATIFDYILAAFEGELGVVVEAFSRFFCGSGGYGKIGKIPLKVPLGFYRDPVPLESLWDSTGTPSP